MANIQHIYNGVGAPTTTPPDIGLHYVDTSTEENYISVGTTDSSDWAKTGAGEVGLNEYWIQHNFSTTTEVVPLDADIIHIERTDKNTWGGVFSIELPVASSRTRYGLYIHLHGVYTGDISGDSILDQTVTISAPGSFGIAGDSDYLSTYSFEQNAMVILSLMSDPVTNTWIVSPTLNVGDVEVIGSKGQG